ncbi:hypothetical protein KCU65_g460, partial [Aureobasidium melanogenum]
LYNVTAMAGHTPGQLFEMLELCSMPQEHSNDHPFWSGPVYAFPDAAARGRIILLLWFVKLWKSFYHPRLGLKPAVNATGNMSATQRVRHKISVLGNQLLRCQRVRMHDQYDTLDVQTYVPGVCVDHGTAALRQYLGILREDLDSTESNLVVLDELTVGTRNALVATTITQDTVTWQSSTLPRASMLLQGPARLSWRLHVASIHLKTCITL